MGKFKKIVYQDITNKYNFSEVDLESYIFISNESLAKLYCPIVTRVEGDSFISSWTYSFNSESKIISTNMLVLGEQSLKKSELYTRTSHDHYIDKVNDIEKKINENSNLFPDHFFFKSFDKTKEKYCIEIIIQNLNFRVRFRSIFGEEIVYDLYYDSLSDKLSYNIYNPSELVII